jgi:Fe-S-cluster-containing hydrogenase component 2
MEKITMAVTIDDEKCTACGACAEVCPVDAITVEDTAVVDADTCIDCGTCVDECPVDAIEL